MKRYESDRILGLSVMMNGSSILFINVYFPVACHESMRNISCVLVYLVPYLNPMKRIMYAYWETLVQHLVLPMTRSIEEQKAKHTNWKFEDAGLKCRFYQRLDSMLGVAPSGLLRVNRGADANMLDDLLTFMSNALRATGIYLGCIILQNSMHQGGMSEQRS